MIYCERKMYTMDYLIITLTVFALFGIEIADREKDIVLGIVFFLVFVISIGIGLI